VRLLLVRLPRPPRVNALHYAAFKLHWHDIALLTAAPHSGEALGAAGNSTLWASLSAQTPAGLEHLNAAQALEFAQTLETQQEGAMRAALGGDDGGDRTAALPRAGGWSAARHRSCVGQVAGNKTKCGGAYLECELSAARILIETVDFEETLGTLRASKFGGAVERSLILKKNV
jgi:hypothetical protein